MKSLNEIDRLSYRDETVGNTGDCVIVENEILDTP
jgi:hypothetical protein